MLQQMKGDEDRAARNYSTAVALVSQFLTLKIWSIHEVFFYGV